jgi:hypothetical protein
LLAKKALCPRGRGQRAFFAAHAGVAGCASLGRCAARGPWAAPQVPSPACLRRRPSAPEDGDRGPSSLRTRVSPAAPAWAAARPEVLGLRLKSLHPLACEEGPLPPSTGTEGNGMRRRDPLSQVLLGSALARACAMPSLRR